jgi:hypothetical protein
LHGSGLLDLGSNPVPTVFEFNKKTPVTDVYRLLSERIL